MFGMVQDTPRVAGHVVDDDHYQRQAAKGINCVESRAATWAINATAGSE